MTTQAFDVFFSHNSRDKPAVIALAKRLAENGIKVWLDAWELRPGHPWQEELGKIIESTRTAVVLVGRDGIGPWEDAEMRACLDEFVKRKQPVIPVLLPGCPHEPDLPLLLRRFSWVDLRNGREEEGFSRLIWGITGSKPSVVKSDSSVVQPAPPVQFLEAQKPIPLSSPRSSTKATSKFSTFQNCYFLRFMRGIFGKSALELPSGVEKFPVSLEIDNQATSTPTSFQGNNIYLFSLSVENIRCFGAKQILDLSDGNGRPAQWTVILGDNGKGKTTLLQILASMEVITAWANENTISKTFDTFLRLGSKELLVNIEFAFGTTLKNIEKQFNKINISYILTPQGRIASNYIPDQSIIFYAYGASRRLCKSTLSKSQLSNTTLSLFNDQADLINAEEWLLQTDYAASKKSSIRHQAQKRFELIKDILITLLPEVDNIRISIHDVNQSPRAEFKTPDGWLRLNALSLGYQTMISWMVDLAAHMFQRYPDSPNPIAEPAVVLIDEIDLHLHPKWQRTIMAYLSERFVNTQFIVTAHSPLIVQAAENANIAVLKREGDQVVIHQQPQDVKGWRIDQLLTSDLFDLPSARSPHYETLLEHRRHILSKAELTEDDQAELKKLEADIGDLPTAETAEDIEAMDIIRRAAKLLKPES